MERDKVRHDVPRTGIRTGEEHSGEDLERLASITFLSKLLRTNLDLIWFKFLYDRSHSIIEFLLLKSFALFMGGGVVERHLEIAQPTKKALPRQTNCQTG